MLARSSNASVTVAEPARMRRLAQVAASSGPFTPSDSIQSNSKLSGAIDPFYSPRQFVVGQRVALVGTLYAIHQPALEHDSPVLVTHIARELSFPRLAHGT